jgi:uncharacterized protein (TIGR00369 family)
MEEFQDSGECFVCGEKNPRGLKLRFRLNREAGEAETDIVFLADFQGWKGFVHGGLLATVLDEALVWAARAKLIKCVTGEMTVRFVAPAKTGERYKIVGRVIEEKGRIVLAESELTDAGGRQIARAHGKLFKI